MNKYNQPRQSYSKKDCTCTVCGGEIKKDSECIIDPKKRTAKHLNCNVKKNKTPAT